MTKRVKPVKQTKHCARCGKSFENRKKWASRGVWDDVKYCSKRCKNAIATELVGTNSAHDNN